MFYYFLVELLTQYDITKFHDHGPRIGTLHAGGGGQNPPSLAVPDSEKPSLFRVNMIDLKRNLKLRYPLSN